MEPWLQEYMHISLTFSLTPRFQEFIKPVHVKVFLYERVEIKDQWCTPVLEFDICCSWPDKEEKDIVKLPGPASYVVLSFTGAVCLVDRTDLLPVHKGDWKIKNLL